MDIFSEFGSLGSLLALAACAVVGYFVVGWIIDFVKDKGALKRGERVGEYDPARDLEMTPEMTAGRRPNTARDARPRPAPASERHAEQDDPWAKVRSRNAGQIPGPASSQPRSGGFTLSNDSEQQAGPGQAPLDIPDYWKESPAGQGNQRGNQGGNQPAAQFGTQGNQTTNRPAPVPESARRPRNGDFMPKENSGDFLKK